MAVVICSRRIRELARKAARNELKRTMLAASYIAASGYARQQSLDSGLDVGTKFPCNMYLGRDTRR